MSGQEHAAQAAEKRRARRDEVETRVTLHVETAHVEGMSDNLSEAGLMFFTDQPIRCSVEVQDEGGIRRYEGRIVRLQRMNETNTGLAVEFDAD